MLVYPELTKEELENLNQMVQPIDRFFNEGCKLNLINNQSVQTVDRFFNEGCKLHTSVVKSY
jgi:hypothetical protein